MRVYTMWKFEGKRAPMCMGKDLKLDKNNLKVPILFSPCWILSVNLGNMNKSLLFPVETVFESCV